MKRKNKNVHTIITEIMISTTIMFFDDALVFIVFQKLVAIDVKYYTISIYNYLERFAL